MSDEVLDLLKLCLMALLYLFFVRVLWAVWTEVRQPVAATPAPTAQQKRPAKAKRARRRGDPVLIVVAPAAVRGQTYEVRGESTIGRGGGCQIRVDDGFASQVHARVVPDGNGVLVDDLGSTNGTYVNDERIAGPASLRRGYRVRVGDTILELQ